MLLGQRAAQVGILRTVAIKISPQRDDYSGRRITIGAVGLIAVAKVKDDVKRKAAMDLARYFTSGEVQVDVPPGSNVPTGFYLAPGARKSNRPGPTKP